MRGAGDHRGKDEMKGITGLLIFGGGGGGSWKRGHTLRNTSLNNITFWDRPLIARRAVRQTCLGSLEHILTLRQ